MDERQLEGFWSYTAFETDGVKRTPGQVAPMAKLVLLAETSMPDWNGIWAVVAYGYEGAPWPEMEVKAACRHIILGTDREQDAPASESYVWAGGRFRIAPRKSHSEIDFESYWKGAVVPCPPQLGIYRLDDGWLTLCLGDSGQPRPSKFNSVKHARQSLAQLVRGESGEIRRSR